MDLGSAETAPAALRLLDPGDVEPCGCAPLTETVSDSVLKVPLEKDAGLPAPRERPAIYSAGSGEPRERPCPYTEPHSVT